MNIVFAGTPHFAAAHLDALIKSTHQILTVVTQPDKPGKRGKRLVSSPVKSLALEAGLPVLQPIRLLSSDLAELKPDLLIVVAFGQILDKDVLELPHYGSINIHASLLPRWRGAAPIQRAILAGDYRSGVCVMQMDEGLDTGDILASKELKISDTETAGTLSTRLTKIGVEQLLNVLTQFEQNTISALPQTSERTTYAKKIAKQDAQIDWNTDIHKIYRQIRAFNPEPIAYSFLGDLRVKIWKAETSETDHTESPGTITRVDVSGIHVAAKNGCVILTQTQLPLGKGAILTARDILNSRKDIFFPRRKFKSNA